MEELDQKMANVGVAAPADFDAGSAAATSTTTMINTKPAETDIPVVEAVSVVTA